MANNALSQIRAAAGRSGAASRWKGRGNDRATACLRVYPADASRIRAAAKERGVLPADIIAEALRHG